MEQPTTTYHYHVSFETTFNFTLNSLGRLKQSRVWTQVQYIRLFDYSRKRRWTRKHLDIRIGQKSTGMLHFRFKYLKNNHNRPTCTSTTHIYTWTNRKITDTTQIHSHMLLLLMFNHDAIHKRNRHICLLATTPSACPLWAFLIRWSFIFASTDHYGWSIRLNNPLEKKKGWKIIINNPLLTCIHKAC